MEGTITRKAIGRAAPLGALYDGSSDKFCGLPILREPPPKNSIFTVDIPNVNYKYEFEDSLSKKFSSLNVEAQLKVSILCGLFSLEGSGKYFSENKESAHSIKINFIYEIVTKQEDLNLHAVNKIIALNALETREATHVVTSIKWGAAVICSLEMNDVEHEEKRTIEGKLKAQMEKIALSIKGSASVQFSESEAQLLNRLSIKFSGDIIPENNLPQSVEAALELMKSVPNLVKNYNEGKGKPLEYTMVSIKDIEQLMKHRIQVDRLLRQVDSSTLIRIEQEFDDLLAAKQEFNDIYNAAMSVKDSVNQVLIDQLIMKKKDIAIYESKLRSKVAEALKAVRTGDMETRGLEDVISATHADPCSSDGIRKFINNNRPTIERVNFIALLKRKGVEHIPRTSSMSHVQQTHNDCDAFVLCYSTSLQDQQPESWANNFELFLKLVAKSAANKSNTATKFFALDYDTHTSFQPNDTTRIVHFINGHSESADYEKDKGHLVRSCVVKPSEPESRKRPFNQAKLSLPCPEAPHLCQNKKHSWKCLKCSQTVMYGFDNFCYCECGAWNPATASFLCDDPRHGPKFSIFGSEKIQASLPQTPPLDEIVILLLGETGVGKSTFINALVNYLTFNKMTDADEVISVLPASFVVTDENYRPKVISLGSEDKNEHNNNTGASATQGPKSYVIPIGNKTLRIIDTPGIGDTRGIEQDKKNFQSILTYLSYHEYIHGVCMLLKPNDSRLNVFFRFCIRELLSHLHKSARDNILFCFTNARSTFYRPGNTFTPLQTLLKEFNDANGIEIPLNKNNIFCFDNESFRFLAANKAGVQFDETEKEQFSKSWDKSVEESLRLVQYACMLEPHRTRDTLSLNEARRLINDLSKPIAEIAQNIQANISLAQQKQQELKDFDGSIEDLKSRLFTQYIDLEPVALSQPRTVCTSHSCVTVHTIAGVQRVDYTTHCHVACYLQGVACDTINNPILQDCAAMSNGVCTKCRCSWTKHMHITYENKQVTKMTPSKTAQDSLNQTQNQKEAVKKMVEELEAKIAALKKEQEEITETCAKFALFLHQNAIISFNDALIEYIDHLIGAEDAKRAAASSLANGDTTLASINKVIAGLREMKRSYEEQFNAFKKALEQNSSQSVNITVDDVQSLITKLYTLPLNGQKLKEIMDVRQRMTKAAVMYEETVYQPKNKKNSKVWQKLKSFFSF